MNMLSFLLGAPIRAQRAASGLTAHRDDLPRLQAYYDAEIAPLSRKFENQRIQALKQARQRIYLGLGIFLALLISCLPLVKPGAQFVPFSWLAAIGIAFLIWRWASSPMRKYTGAVHSEIYPRIFRFFGPDFVFAKGQDMGIRMFKEAKILPSYDKARFDDCVLGSHLGVSIGINEIHLLREERDKDKNRDVTVFQGLLISLSSHKAFRGHTVAIRSRGALTNFFSDTHGGLERVHLEDPQFEKMFDVFSTDQIEARVLLTTAFMERLMALAQFFSSRIQCAFHRDRLLITIESSQNRFEQSSIFSAATFEDDFSRIHGEMKQLFAIIELLKLNEYTGL
ncbi:DUF3137 domain-containing protein [Shewanella litorisediminis]|uniref:DUF3137 domain-containing protein n=1 Tax=Shewanella litorisediminis TaxID=1173586 RepID=A0ABX7G360_9GAMM|nr:DUF3137 domain-containing protein [Shewanella litorisediminis]MCL2917302.1 DUF3137 domain-containing protein [Shewanella litorisediminis]QRH01772.1 DUF3137 domain-containing protein [Shewanella litorisediminis]